MNSLSAELNFVVWTMLVLRRITSVFVTLSGILLALSQNIRSLFRVLLMARMLSRMFTGPVLSAK